MTVDAAAYERVELADFEHDIVLGDGDPIAFFVNGEIAPTVRGANTYPPDKRVVVVDAGAVSFVSDGADIMRPGIVEADEAIQPDDLVVIEDETHRKVLAIGQARVVGTELLGDSGKVISSIHHVGDDLFAFSP